MTTPETTSPAAVRYLEQNEWQKKHAYSPAIITTGGRTIWLAGQTTEVDLEGHDIGGNFEEQARTIFKMIDRTLVRAGGSLANIVTLTQFIRDARDVGKMPGIVREFFDEGRAPCSALVTVTGFARPGSVIEIQGIAVI